MEELEKIACEIDKIIEALSGTFPAQDTIILLFVAGVAGFEELEKRRKEIAEEEGISQEDVDEIIEEQKQAFIKSLNESGKTYIKSKTDELKSMIAQMKSEAAEIPKSIAKATADALLPTMIAPGAPNPASSALRLYLNLVAIKAIVLSVLILTSRILNLLIELGLDKTPLANMVSSVVKPIMSLKKGLDDELTKADNDECEKAKPEDYKVKDPDGNDITGLDIQSKTALWANINKWPLKKKDKRFIKRKAKRADDESDDPIWADIILSYSDFYDKAIA